MRRAWWACAALLLLATPAAAQRPDDWRPVIIAPDAERLETLRRDFEQAVAPVAPGDYSGIAPADAERIFEPFVRLDAARARQTGGTGLGLAIARSIVLAHGGTLTLEPEPCPGSCFVISLPLESS